MTMQLDEKQVYLVPLEQIEPDGNNVRQTQVGKDLADLADSIRAVGQLQPIVLSGESTDTPPYGIVVGQRRFLAHREILSKQDPKWRIIRATFAGRVTDEEMRVRSLIENMQRVELNYADAAKAVTELCLRHGGSDREVARITGMSLKRVRQYLYIEALATESMKERIKKGEVSPTDVKRALQAAQLNIEKAETLLDLMAEKQFTPHEKKRLAEYATAHEDAPPEEMVEEALRPRIEDTIMVSLQSDIKEALVRAVSGLHMEPEEVVTLALGEWLSGKGFMYEA